VTATVYAVANQKGGVGKTTTTLNLATAMAELDAAVLVVDLDPQGCLTFSLGYDPDGIEPSLNDTVVGRAALADTIIQQGQVDLVPANIDLAGAEVTLLARTGREYLLRGELVDLLDSYDVVLIDCPPTLGPLMRLCLAASDSFLVPVQAEEYSYRTLERLLQTTDEVQHTLNPDLTCEGLLLTMVDLRTRMSVRVVNQLHENYGDKVLMGMVPRTVTLQEMPVRGRPTVVHAGSSRGGKAYTEVARELLVNFEPVESTAPVDETSIPAVMVARQGEAAIEDTRSLEDLGEETMISSFPSTHSDNGSMLSTRWGSGHDDFEAWGDDESDRTIN